MKKIKYVLLIFMLIIGAVILTGCSQANRVNWNMNKEADRFNITRRIVVINTISDKPIFEIIGRISLSNNTENELVVTIETENNKYKKHYVYLNKFTTYIVEDVSGAYVDNYHYEVNFLPEMIQPATITTKD